MMETWTVTAHLDHLDSISSYQKLTRTEGKKEQKWKMQSPTVGDKENKPVTSLGWQNNVNMSTKTIRKFKKRKQKEIKKDHDVSRETEQAETEESNCEFEQWTDRKRKEDRSINY